MRARGWGVVTSALAITGAAAFAARGEPAEQKPTYRLDWERTSGAETCSDAAALKDEVKGRLGRDPFSDDAHRVIRGVVTRVGDKWVAKLIVRDDNGPLGDRSLVVDAPTCAPLTTAVALAVALIIDPDAALSPPSASSSIVAPAASPPPSVASSRAPAIVSRVFAPPPIVPSIEPPIAARAHFAAIVAGGVVPHLAPGVALFVDSSHRAPFHARLGALFVPSTKTADDAAAFGVSALTVGACGEIAQEAPFGMIGCAGAFVGVEHAAARVGTSVNPGDEPFGGALATIGVRATPVELLGFELSFGGFVPFVRPRFLVDGRADPVFRPAAVGFFGAFSVGVRL